MDEALTIHRLHFAFTITYHYVFPQLTMGVVTGIPSLYFLYTYRSFAGKVSLDGGGH